MKEVTKYPNHTFSWVDVATPDPEAGKAFYCALFGWTFKDEPAGDAGTYTMLSLNGKSVAGLSGMPPGETSEHGYWTSYVTTYDIEATSARVRDLGGTLLAPPFDVMESGRMALMLDPTGAFSAMWEPKNHIGASIVNQPNSFCWNELLTTNKEAAIKFYSALYGWEFIQDEQSGYTEIRNNGRPAGGMLQITAEMGNIPSSWMVYFTVEDVDATVEQAQELGGGIRMPPFESPGTGRIALLLDPQGIMFYVIQLAVEPDDPPQG